jgi:hypothetical protein
MGMNVGIIIAMGFMGIVAFVIGAFLALRGINQYKAWQAGDQDELWTFLSMIVGCASLIFIGIAGVAFGFGGESVGDEGILALGSLAFVGLLLGLAAIGLTTFYYILKWQSAK